MVIILLPWASDERRFYTHIEWTKVEAITRSARSVGNPEKRKISHAVYYRRQTLTTNHDRS